MSTTCALKLKENGVFCRGTIRSTRRLLPKSILFTPSEVRQLPRGTQICVVNEENEMLAVGWIDNKAVHFISMVDSTETDVVLRKVGNKKVEVSAPIAIKNYNKFMGGVDRHDRLRSSFSICKAHKFRKYYVKLFLFLLDVGLTNAWIYYKICHPETTEDYGSRADFFQSVAESMVNPNTNWTQWSNQLYDDDDAEEQYLAPISAFDNIKFPTEYCIPVPLKTIQMKLSTKIKVCQVCNYELRPFKWRSVTLCGKHGVWLCTETVTARKESLPLLIKKDGTLVKDWSRTCPQSKSCWAKYHDFYQPRGLINTYFYFDNVGKTCKFSQCIYTSELYQKKYAALGVEVKTKKGKAAGMGRVNERDHIVN